MPGMPRKSPDPMRVQAEARLADAVAGLEQDPAAPIVRKRALVGEGFAVGGKLFAFVGTVGVLIVKLPTARIDDHEGAGTGERVAMGGRVMREWVGLGDDAGQGVWAAAVAEAYAYGVSRLGIAPAARS